MRREDQPSRSSPRDWTITLCDIDVVTIGNQRVHLSTFLGDINTTKVMSEDTRFLEVRTTLLEYATRGIPTAIEDYTRYDVLFQQMNEDLGIDTYGDMAPAPDEKDDFDLTSGYAIPLIACHEGKLGCKMYLLIITKVGDIWERAGHITYWLPENATQDFAQKLAAWLRAQPTADTRILLG